MGNKELDNCVSGGNGFGKVLFLFVSLDNGGDGISWWREFEVSGGLGTGRRQQMEGGVCGV